MLLQRKLNRNIKKKIIVKTFSVNGVWIIYDIDHCITVLI